MNLLENEEQKDDDITVLLLVGDCVLRGFRTSVFGQRMRVCLHQMGRVNTARQSLDCGGPDCPTVISNVIRLEPLVGMCRILVELRRASTGFFMHGFISLRVSLAKRLAGIGAAHRFQRGLPWVGS